MAELQSFITSAFLLPATCSLTFYKFNYLYPIWLLLSFFLPANISNVELILSTTQWNVLQETSCLQKPSDKWKGKCHWSFQFETWYGQIRIHCQRCGRTHSFSPGKKSFYTISGNYLIIYLSHYLLSYLIKHQTWDSQ